MAINPKIDDQTTNVLGDPANVGVLHTAKGNAYDPANVGVLHTAKENAHDPANVGAHPARIELHTAKGNVHEPAKGNAHDPANVGVHPAMGELHTAKGNVHDPANVVPHTANPHTTGVNTDNTSVIHESNAGNSYADMARKSGSDSSSVGTKINFRYMLIDRESELLASFRVASLDEERFLKQKSKVHWLAEGDANTKYFHNTLKCRNHRARIDVITDSNGILHEGKEVPNAFVNHYVGFLGREEAVIIPITQELFDARIDQAI
ncbi:hypothetical protein QVD17_11941 [Tagetes erecta]|uniref:Uncharacterized protein n=1 Tax=Tagetes erecta TaxID=13708 RepID=A0AAD8P1C1_TARER|nr:hypothetical protein QVD17_11941 [Tagetes erecta]